MRHGQPQETPPDQHRPPPPQASRFGSGQAVPRPEDAQLLRGEGRYVDDFAPDGLAHLVFVRSPHAHARLRGVDADAARALPGVLAVHTGADRWPRASSPARPRLQARGWRPRRQPARRTAGA